MDYDDNDFHNPNLHLAGEGSSTFSPVLRPYALPKFDFDDSLQGHLRFDSLVENEVFLGIPSQEDNQWIEDFSRGSSGAEFSSSAAKSCSISRRNNVWYEATSSESVEMLLKAVGQEERVLGETVIEESDAGNELGRFTKQMESNLNQDDRMDDAIHSQPALPPDEFPDNFSGLNEGAGGECAHVKCTSQTREAELSACGSLSELDSNAVTEKCILFVTKESAETDRKCDDADKREVNSSVNESLYNKMQEDPSVSGIQIANIDSPQNVITSTGELNDLEIPHQVSDICFKNASGLPKDLCNGVEEQNVRSKEANMDDQILSGTAVETCAYNVESPLCVTTKVESIEEHDVEIGTTNFEEPSSLPLKGDCDLQIAEGSNEDVCSTESSEVSKCEVRVDESPVVFLGDSSFEGHAIEVGNVKAGISDCPELKIGSLKQITHGQRSSKEKKENFIGSDDQIYGGASFSSFEASVVSGVDNKLVEQGGGSSINHVCGLASLMVTCSSSELLGEESLTENLKCGNEGPGVNKEDSNAEDHISLPMLGASMQMYKENLSSKQCDVHNCDQDVSSHERENPKLPTGSRAMECEVVGSLDRDKRVGSSSSGEGVEGNIVTAHGSEFDTTTGNEQALDIAVEDADLASGNTLIGVPSLSRSGATVGDIIDHVELKPPVLGLGFKHVDKKDERKVEVPREASLSNPKESSQVDSERHPGFEGPVSEVGKGASRDCAAQMLHQTVDQLVPMVEARNVASQSEEQAVADEVGQECSEKLEVVPDLCDSTVKEGDDTEAAAFESHKETMIETNREVSSLEVADAVLVKNARGLLTEPTSLSLVERCYDMDQKDHDDNEAILASRVNNSEQIAVHSSNDHQASFDLTCLSKCEANHMLECEGSSTDLAKPTCDSPTIITSSEFSQSEKDKQEGAMVENVQLSKVTYDVDSKVQSISSHLRGKGGSKEEGTFTFVASPPASLSEGESGKVWQSFPTIQAGKISTILEGSPSASSGGQIVLKTAQEISRGSPQTPGGGIAHVGAPERKTRRGTGRAGKENAKKNRVKETTSLRQSEGVDKSCVSMGPPRTGQLKFDELKPYVNVEHSGTKPCGVISIPTSNLPDLNTSVPPSALFQQPFTDLQQVQLRAQIFVYGSLIQGAAPEESCMISAFGPSDGGRSLWEPGWRAFVERLHGEKSRADKSETPVQSRSGTTAPDQGIKHGALQSKALSSPVGRASSKGTPLPVVNPIIPLSSPLWNVSTSSCDGLQSSGMPRGAILDYHRALPPLPPYQTPMRNFVGHNPSWLSQAPFPGPWVASPQTPAFDVSAHFPMLPFTETVKLTPVKESSVPISSGTKHASPIPVAYSGGACVFAGSSSVSDVKKVTVSSGQQYAVRKRKKVPVLEGLGQISLPAQTCTESVCAPVVGSQLANKFPVTEDVGQISLLGQSQTGSVSVPVVSSIFSTSVTVTTPACFASKSNSGKLLSAVSPKSSSDHPSRGDQNEEKKVTTSEQTFSKVEEAKQQAEDAAKNAAAAVCHCQGVWSQLDKQKNSGLISDVEARLASADVAIAAAASVAKAAAAAAKIASNAAAQAKSMADEVLVGTEDSIQSSSISLPNVAINLGKATPASILKGGDASLCSSSIIVAAREAARRRVEAASAASKHAENLDAIVKAAELAAEAVSQAGKIVAMGDLLFLSELVESGPEGYWKIPQVSSEQGVKSNNLNKDQSITDSVEVPNFSAKQSKEGLSDKETQTMNRGMSLLPKDVSGDFMGDNMRVVDGISGSVTSHGKDTRGKRGRRASGLAKTIRVAPESESELRSPSVAVQDENRNALWTSKENSMKEGCLVEVFRVGNFKPSWFSANVLSLNDGKAFVCYTELQSEEGSGQLKEWVQLEGEATKVPRIRMAHPTTTMRFEGTRKRRRAAVTDYAWSVGDRVDAWIQDSWHEGVVTERNKNDETQFTVHFPGQRETLVVKAWHLRPTLIWMDGEWTEWSSSRAKCSSQGDTPQEKRLKVGSPATEGKGKEKMSKHADLVESGKPEESRLLPLSANEKIFDVGKNASDENNLEALRTMRSGLQKEGSRVVFGVPKPSKKRKFMDVSKQYVSERSSKNNSVANDTVKFARYLMPQGLGSRGRKNNLKNDAKQKQAADSKPKALKSERPPNVSGRTVPQKDNSLNSAKSASHDPTVTDHIVKDPVSNEGNESGRQNLIQYGSSSDTGVAAEGPVLVSEQGFPADAPSKKVPSSIAKSEQLNKGKLALAIGKSAKAEVKDISIPDVVEPRRSNRRIQPTSRLLEGLQSSLIISKMPAVPHDKSHRSQNSTSHGNSNDG